ncbi:cysteine proteinase [Neocallimastix sp. 'constans']
MSEKESAESLKTGDPVPIIVPGRRPTEPNNDKKFFSPNQKKKKKSSSIGYSPINNLNDSLRNNKTIRQESPFDLHLDLQEKKYKEKNPRLIKSINLKKRFLNEKEKTIHQPRLTKSKNEINKIHLSQNGSFVNLDTDKSSAEINRLFCERLKREKEKEEKKGKKILFINEDRDENKNFTGNKSDIIEKKNLEKKILEKKNSSEINTDRDSSNNNIYNHPTKSMINNNVNHSLMKVGQKRFVDLINKPLLNGKNEELLIYPFKGIDSVIITTEDVERLKSNFFLNDSIIEFYLKYLYNHLPPTSKEKFHFINSFFFEQISRLSKKEKTPKEIYQSIKKWTSKVDLFKKRYLMIPINKDYHWHMLVIFNPGALLNEKKIDNKRNKNEKNDSICQNDDIQKDKNKIPTMQNSINSNQKLNISKNYSNQSSSSSNSISNIFSKNYQSIDSNELSTDLPSCDKVSSIISSESSNIYEKEMDISDSNSNNNNNNYNVLNRNSELPVSLFNSNSSLNLKYIHPSMKNNELKNFTKKDKTVMFENNKKRDSQSIQNSINLVNKIMYPLKENFINIESNSSENNYIDKKIDNSIVIEDPSTSSSSISSPALSSAVSTESTTILQHAKKNDNNFKLNRINNKLDIEKNVKSTPSFGTINENDIKSSIEKNNNEIVIIDEDENNSPLDNNIYIDDSILDNDNNNDKSVNEENNKENSDIYYKGKLILEDILKENTQEIATKEKEKINSNFFEKSIEISSTESSPLLKERNFKPLNNNDMKEKGSNNEKYEKLKQNKQMDINNLKDNSSENKNEIKDKNRNGNENVDKNENKSEIEIEFKIENKNNNKNNNKIENENKNKKENENENIDSSIFNLEKDDSILIDNSNILNYSNNFSSNDDNNENENNSENNSDISNVSESSTASFSSPSIVLYSRILNNELYVNNNYKMKIKNNKYMKENVEISNQSIIDNNNYDDDDENVDDNDNDDDDDMEIEREIKNVYKIPKFTKPIYYPELSNSREDTDFSSVTPSSRENKFIFSSPTFPSSNQKNEVSSILPRSHKTSNEFNINIQNTDESKKSSVDLSSSQNILSPTTSSKLKLIIEKDHNINLSSQSSVSNDIDDIAQLSNQYEKRKDILDEKKNGNYKNCDKKEESFNSSYKEYQSQLNGCYHFDKNDNNNNSKSRDDKSHLIKNNEEHNKNHDIKSVTSTTTTSGICPQNSKIYLNTPTPYKFLINTRIDSSSFQLNPKELNSNNKRPLNNDIFKKCYFIIFDSLAYTPQHIHVIKAIRK